MNRRNLTSWFAGCWLAIAAAASARAQAVDAFCEPACAHDMQLFAPVDFDFDCMPIKNDCGWFFNYSRVSWFITGERAPLGSPGATVLSEEIYPAILAFNFGDTPPPQYLIQNGIQNGLDSGKFGWGNRYEFGYTTGQSGWEVGIIEKQRQNQAVTFGEGPQTNGFGSIHVNMELADPRLLEGFRDYNGQTIQGEEIPTPTLGGPGVGGNGVADDLDGDLSGFGFLFIDVDGNGIFDGDDIIVGIFVDYGDLYNFNLTFNQVNLRSSTETDGIEIMKTFSLDNRHEYVKEQNAHTEIGAGVRFLRIRDEFGFSGTSDLLTGTNFLETHVDNLIVGPQIHARYEKQLHRFNVGVDGRFVFGYNVQNLSQAGTFGGNLLVGGLNQPAVLQPTSFTYGKQANSFSPMAELRLDLSYQLTGSMALKLGYTAMYIDNVTRAASVTRWRLPDGGFTETSAQNILLNGADAGVEFIY
jgi:hypothetical protein